MRYEDEELQDRLAAEFVLGNLRGAARRRLVALMRQHDGLRREVAQWEERIYPLALRAPRVEPPRRVWRGIHARIAPRREQWCGWWRFVAAGAALVAIALAYVMFAPPRAPGFTMIAVLNDPRAEPGIFVTWTAHQGADRMCSRVGCCASTAESRARDAPALPAGTMDPRAGHLLSFGA